MGFGKNIYIDGKKVDSIPSIPTLQSFMKPETVEDILIYNLNGANDRDVELHNQHLEEITSVINDLIEGSVQIKLGGSVSKKTYVEGLSDVDVLLLLDRSELVDKSPNEVKTYVAKVIEDKLPGVQHVEVGKMAVTISFRDGTEIQLIPAVKSYTGYRIPNQTGKEWSHVVHPEKFAGKLTEINQSCGKNVIPVVKLVKKLNRNLEDRNDESMSGYHIEALAVQIFRNYPSDAPHTKTAMLVYFLEHAKEAVLKPINDKSGQSIHVDDYAGEENSSKRRFFSRELKQWAEDVQLAKDKNNPNHLPPVFLEME